MVSVDSMPSDTDKNKSTKNGANSITVMSGYSDNGDNLSVDQSSKKSKLSNLKGTEIVYVLMRSFFFFNNFWIGIFKTILH